VVCNNELKEWKMRCGRSEIRSGGKGIEEDKDLK